MALTNTQLKIALAMQDLEDVVLQLKPRLQAATAMYGTEDMANLTDSDYAAIADFVGKTVAEMTAAKNAFMELSTTIGEYVAGSVAYRLLKIAKKVP